MENFGYVVATKKVINDKRKVCFMYREEPSDQQDSGWRFGCGDETQEYYDDPNNLVICSINAVLGVDPSIKPYLSAKVNSAFERENENDVFSMQEDFASDNDN